MRLRHRSGCCGRFYCFDDVAHNAGDDLLVIAFRHHANDGLGAGWTNDEAAVFAELRLSAFDRLDDTVVVKRLAAGVTHIAQDLRKRMEAIADLRNRLAGRDDASEDLQSGDEAVAGRRALVSGMAPGVSGIWLVDLTDGPDAAHVTRIVGAPAQIPGDELGSWMPPTRPLTVEGPTGPVHAFVHPPTNPHATGPAGERPPYLVLVHGGPTGHEGGVADGKTLFFTSRGIGVLEVNYGGSTGYGRAYRQRLHGQWGVVDV